MSSVSCLVQPLIVTPGGKDEQFGGMGEGSPRLTYIAGKALRKIQHYHEVSWFFLLMFSTSLLVADPGEACCSRRWGTSWWGLVACIRDHVHQSVLGAAVSCRQYR